MKLCMIQEAANAKAEAIFKTLDTNGDGSLDEEEFCEGCLNDPEFAGMIQVSKLLFVSTSTFNNIFIFLINCLFQTGVDKLKTEQDFAQKLNKL